MSLSGFSGREDAQVGSDNAQRPGSEGGGGDAVTTDWTLNSSRCTMRTSEDLGEWVK